MISNGKTLNYKVVDIVESYNFHIKFISIRVQTKKLQIFEKRRTPTSALHVVICIVLKKKSNHIFLQIDGEKL
jgi:hypothetical protein